MTAMPHNPCEVLAGSLSSLFVCSQQGDYTRLRTPYLYPDGDVVDLFVKQHDAGKGTVTDLGETVRWLRSQTLSPRRTTRQTQLIGDICMTHGVELFKGMLLARYQDESELADVTMRVAQASIRVADLWLSFRNRAVESVTDEVEDFLKEQAIPYNRSPRLVGRSGRIWTPTFQTRTEDRSALIYVLGTGSRSAAKGVTEHALAAWFDLSHLVSSPDPMTFVSLFDDTADVWSREDFQLVDQISNIARWSDPDGLKQIITAKAA